MKTAAFILMLTAFFPQLAEADEGKEVMVNADYLNIRDSEGGILCTVPFGTALEVTERHADGRRVKVRFPAAGHPAGCPGEGIVNGNFLDPINDNGDPEERAIVDVNGLAFRSSPKARHSTFRCSLKRGTQVKVTDKEYALSDETPWIKVALLPAQKGCPEEGFVYHSYLRGVNPFIDLPLMKGTVEAENGSIAQCCDRPGEEHPATTGAIEQIGQVGKELNRKLPDGKVAKRKPLKEARQSPRLVDETGATSSRRIEKMIVEAHAAARKYRNFAPHVCKRRGRGYPCGGSANPGMSKGWCKAGVKEAIFKTTGKMITGDSAMNAKAWLDKNFARVSGANSCKEAPVGAICLYDRRPVHNFGHIEIRTGNFEYCSDFCTNHPIRVGKFIGAYMP